MCRHATHYGTSLHLTMTGPRAARFLVGRGLVRVQSSDWHAQGHNPDILTPPAPGAYTYIHEMAVHPAATMGDDLRRIKARAGGAAGQVDKYSYISNVAPGSRMQEVGGPWVVIELPPWLWVVPSHYSLGRLCLQEAGGDDASSTAEAGKAAGERKEVEARDWRVEGSADGATWYLLRHHRDDCSLSAPGAPATHTWPVDVRVMEEAIRFVRLVFESDLPEDFAAPGRLLAAGFDIYGAAASRRDQPHLRYTPPPAPMQPLRAQPTRGAALDLISAYNNWAEYIQTFGQTLSHSAARAMRAGTLPSSSEGLVEEESRTRDRALEAYAAACALFQRVRPESWPLRAGLAAAPVAFEGGKAGAGLSAKEQVMASVQARRMEANAAMCQGEAGLARLTYLSRLGRGDSLFKADPDAAYPGRGAEEEKEKTEEKEKEPDVGPAADGEDARSPEHPLAVAEGILRDELVDVAGALDAALKLTESAARAGDGVTTFPAALARWMQHAPDATSEWAMHTPFEPQGAAAGVESIYRTGRAGLPNSSGGEQAKSGAREKKGKSWASVLPGDAGKVKSAAEQEREDLAAREFAQRAEKAAWAAGAVSSKEELEAHSKQEQVGATEGGKGGGTGGGRGGGRKGEYARERG